MISARIPGNAPVAQWIEQSPPKRQVARSIRVRGTKKPTRGVAVLEVIDLACQRGDRLLFRGLSFSLRPGTMMHVRGENGCGKTTLLRTLCGLTQAATGEIHWQGLSIHEQFDHFREQLCYVGHANAVHGDLTPVENLQFAACWAGEGKSDARSLLSGFGLRRVAGLSSKLLSQGQKRRVALARLSSLRKLWILDEPFAALDTRALDRLRDVLSQHLDRGGMCLLTSHQDVVIDGRQVLTLDLA